MTADKTAREAAQAIAIAKDLKVLCPDYPATVIVKEPDGDAMRQVPGDPNYCEASGRALAEPLSATMIEIALDNLPGDLHPSAAAKRFAAECSRLSVMNARTEMIRSLQDQHAADIKRAVGIAKSEAQEQAISAAAHTIDTYRDLNEELQKDLARVKKGEAAKQSTKSASAVGRIKGIAVAQTGQSGHIALSDLVRQLRITPETEGTLTASWKPKDLTTLEDLREAFVRCEMELSSHDLALLTDAYRTGRLADGIG